MKKEIPVGDAGKRPDEHVLRVAGDGRNAADIRGRCNREQMGQRANPHAFCRGQHKGYHDQADDVVDEKCGQDAAREYDRRQQMVWLQARHHQFRDPVEKARQVQVGDNKHHREQQHQSAEINRAQGLQG